MNRSLDELLANLTLSGACATRDPIDEIVTAAEAKGFGAYNIDLSTIDDKPALMREMQEALDFPQWFGHNWDALEDCLTDMSWSDHPGYVLLISGGSAFRKRDKALFETLVDVLKTAADYWRGEERAFWAFFLAVEPGPTLPACP